MTRRNHRRRDGHCLHRQDPEPLSLPRKPVANRLNPEGEAGDCFLLTGSTKSRESEYAGFAARPSAKAWLEGEGLVKFDGEVEMAELWSDGKLMWSKSKPNTEDV